MGTIERNIAKTVCLAQNASDAGKGIYELRFSNTDTRFADRGYSSKNVYIQRAISMIRNSKPCGWNFYITGITPDQKGNDSVVIYFQYKDVSGNRYEISFHTPADQARAMMADTTKGRKTHWNHDIGGSRNDCQRLIELFNL